MAGTQATPARFVRSIEKPDVFPLRPAGRARGKAIDTRRQNAGQELAVVGLIALNEMLVSPIVIHL